MVITPCVDFSRAALGNRSGRYIFQELNNLLLSMVQRSGTMTLGLDVEAAHMCNEKTGRDMQVIASYKSRCILSVF